MVLFNGMEKTSHWAALYFVTLMTFGNYVLFNLLVAILVEGFSSEVRSISASRARACNGTILTFLGLFAGNRSVTSDGSVSSASW